MSAVRNRETLDWISKDRLFKSVNFSENGARADIFHCKNLAELYGIRKVVILRAVSKRGQFKEYGKTLCNLKEWNNLRCTTGLLFGLSFYKSS